MKLWIAIVMLMFATVGHAGKAEAGYYIPANQLLKWCESDKLSDNAMCMGYVAGIADTYDASGNMSKEFCIPDDVGVTQLTKVVIAGLSLRPEYLQSAASPSVFHAFYKAFPC